MRHAYRFGVGAATPTPPPVAVTIANEQEPQPLHELETAHFDEEESSTPSKRRSGVAWLPILAVVAVCMAFGWRYFRHLRHEAAGVSLELPAARLLPVAAPAPAASADDAFTVEVQLPPSDTVRRDGHVPLDDGVLLLPKSFRPEAGGYDLIIHFHGDVAIVKESVTHANLNAALAIINVGVNSGPYRDAFQRQGHFERLLAQIHRGLQVRGVPEGELRRLALTAWSGGYGAIEGILTTRLPPERDRDPLDAIIVLDGIHCGFIDGDKRRMNPLSIRPFVWAARAAAEGELMFSMTHSEIDPITYASTKRTSAFLLKAVGATRNASAMLPLPPTVRLAAAAKAVASDRVQGMVPLSDTRAGTLRIQGFAGNTREHHAAHLTQMAAVGLPDLAARWAP